MKSIFKELLELAKVIFSVFIFLIFLLFFAINLFLKPYVLKEISAYLKSEVKCQVMYVTPFRGIKVICVKPTASNKYGRFLSADRAIIDVDISNIRGGAVRFPSIILTGAAIDLFKSGGKFNIEELIQSIVDDYSEDHVPPLQRSDRRISAAGCQQGGRRRSGIRRRRRLTDSIPLSWRGRSPGLPEEMSLYLA